MERGKGEITPISQGQEIRIEKVMERLREFQGRVNELLERIRAQQSWREDLFQLETDKPLEKMNFELIAALQEELENLKKIEDELEEKIIKSWEHQDELRKRWLEAVDRSETIAEAAFLDSLVEKFKNYDKKPPEKR